MHRRPHILVVQAEVHPQRLRTSRTSRISTRIRRHRVELVRAAAAANRHLRRRAHPHVLHLDATLVALAPGRHVQPQLDLLELQPAVAQPKVRVQPQHIVAPRPTGHLERLRALHHHPVPAHIADRRRELNRTAVQSPHAEHQLVLRPHRPIHIGDRQPPGLRVLAVRPAHRHRVRVRRLRRDLIVRTQVLNLVADPRLTRRARRQHRRTHHHAHPQPAHTTRSFDSD